MNAAMRNETRKENSMWSHLPASRGVSHVRKPVDDVPGEDGEVQEVRRCARRRKGARVLLGVVAVARRHGEEVVTGFRSEGHNVERARNLLHRTGRWESKAPLSHTEMLKMHAERRYEEGSLRYLD